MTAQGLSRELLMGRTITHLRLLKAMLEGNITVANIIEDSEITLAKYRERRAELLARLPEDLDIVKLDARRPAGRKVQFGRGSWMHGNIFRMVSTLSPSLNNGLTNYVITKKGAEKILNKSKGFDSFGRWEHWDQYLLSKLLKESSKKKGAFVGFAVTMDTLSTNCASTRPKHRWSNECKL